MNYLFISEKKWFALNQFQKFLLKILVRAGCHKFRMIWNRFYSTDALRVPFWKSYWRLLHCGCSSVRHFSEHTRLSRKRTKALKFRHMIWWRSTHGSIDLGKDCILLCKFFAILTEHLIRCWEMFTPEESVRVCFNCYNILLFLFVLFFLSCGFVSLSALSSVIFKFNRIILGLRKNTRTLTYIISLALLLLCGIAAFPYRRLVERWTWECLFSYNS